MGSSKSSADPQYQASQHACQSLERYPLLGFPSASSPQQLQSPSPSSSHVEANVTLLCSFRAFMLLDLFPECPREATGTCSHHADGERCLLCCNCCEWDNSDVDSLFGIRSNPMVNDSLDWRPEILHAQVSWQTGLSLPTRKEFADNLSSLDQ